VARSVVKYSRSRFSPPDKRSAEEVQDCTGEVEGHYETESQSMAVIWAGKSRPLMVPLAPFPSHSQPKIEMAS